MRDGHREYVRSRHGSEPAIHVICLASGGGPNENNVTGFLVRSTSTHWSKGSILAVDAGSHLASITKLLEASFPLVSEQVIDEERRGRPQDISAPAPDESSDESSRGHSPPPNLTALTQGPFAGLPFPHKSARANAVHVVRECVSTYLITHPHLDHISGFVINTAAFYNTLRPKRLAALPSTIHAIKTHIFNDVIWPNLTDEDGGVGFVTFQRLTQGGNIAVGEGSRKGYIEVCDGICVKGMKISHGHCTRGQEAAFHRGSDVGLSEATTYKNSNDIMSPTRVQQTSSVPHLHHHATQPATPTFAANSFQPSAPADPTHREVVVDSTAYFIRDDSTGREILFFGDVEPDALSFSPRNFQIWTEAAPKIVHGNLRAIFVECSYDDSQGDNVLFGHLAPRHLVQELSVLADLVRTRKYERKRKRASSGHDLPRLKHDHSDASPINEETHASSRHSKASRLTLTTTALQNSAHTPVEQPPTPEMPQLADKDAPLVGVTVIVIHVKDTMRDGPPVDDKILRELQEHEAHLRKADGVGLGCDFVISKTGGSYWF